MNMPAEAESSSITCRHCGKRYESSAADPQCPECGRYQDTVMCPTCHQPARASLLNEADVPKPAKPQKEQE